MLATPSAELPHDPGYAFEFKWDGYRAIVHREKGKIRIDSRRLHDVSTQFHQVTHGGPELRGRDFVIDGEIVALDEENRPSFSLLQQHLRVPGSGRVLDRAPPIVFFAFDLLRLDGKSLLREPYQTRRRMLDELDVRSDTWRSPPHEIDQGPAMLTVSQNLRLEGIVAKRLTSPYQPGARSPDWLKIKHRRRQEFVVGGWTPGEGGRRGTFGALVLGYYDRTPQEAAHEGKKPKLVYAGRVGTGFNDPTLRVLLRELRTLAHDRNVFDEGDPGPGVRFVRPELVAEVSFTEWTHLGTLRQTSFHGLRRDKEPGDVVREPVPPTTREET